MYNIGKVITVGTVRRFFQLSVVAYWYRRRTTVSAHRQQFACLLAIAGKVMREVEPAPGASSQDFPEYFARMLCWRHHNSGFGCDGGVISLLSDSYY